MISGKDYHENDCYPINEWLQGLSLYMVTLVTHINIIKQEFKDE